MKKKHIKRMVSTLKVISIWATFQGGSELIPEHVERLCRKALKPVRKP